MKLTEWYPGHIKPSRVGVYQQFCGNHIGYQLWDGKYWRGWWSNPIDAAESQWTPGKEFQNDKWRGLAVNPKKGKK